MEDSGVLVTVYFVYLAFDGLHEFRVFKGRICLEILERFRPVGLIFDVKAQYIFSPLFEFRHFLS